ncbi:MAG: siroheme synthase CysG [Pseudomonadota bacterium]
MRHFPVFLDLRGQRVVVSGAGETAAAKLRLLMKTEAKLFVFGTAPSPAVSAWAVAGEITLVERPLDHGDALCARLVYGANDDPAEDARVAALGHEAGALVNIVDNLGDSDFITPAIVDRDPVTVAIGTEGAAPVLARQIKAANEEQLSSSLGELARIGMAYRDAADAIPSGAPRRQFWRRYYEDDGPRAFSAGGSGAVGAMLPGLIKAFAVEAPADGRVSLVGAGPGDPDLLTMKARRALHDADVIIHDRLVSAEVLELGRREAHFVEVGKIPGGKSWRQDDINALMVSHANCGAHVVRLKSGDPGVYGRLDEEMDALDAADVPFEIVPGITSAMAAAADIQVSLTRRYRNASFRFLTGQDVDGFAEHDWRALSAEGATAAIYMGVRAAPFLQGRLLMHGAAADTPVTAIENASRSNRKVVSTTLGVLADALRSGGIRGPAILFLGLQSRHVAREMAAGLSVDLAGIEGPDTAQPLQALVAGGRS